MNDEQLDHPFDEVVDRAEKLANEGHKVYQKFTCAGCGQRLGMDEPNVFYESGTCDKCGTITDIRGRGCNFLLHAVIK